MSLQEQSDVTNLSAEFSTIATQLYAQLPEEEKQGPFGKALNYIISLGSNGIGFWNKWHSCETFGKGKEVLDFMIDIINRKNTDKKQCCLDAIDHQQINSTYCVIDYQKYFGCNVQQIKGKINECQDAIGLQLEFENAINRTKQNMANKVILDSAKVSSVLLIIQVVKLYFVWKEISKAKNLHKDPTKFQLIEQNIESFREICNELVQTMQMENIRRLSIIMARANMKFNKTKSLISNLRITINGSIQRLELYADAQILDGMCNLATTVGNGVQLFDVSESTSSDVRFIGYLLLLFHSLLTIGNGATYYMIQKNLNELRSDMQKLNTYEFQVEKIYEKIEDVESWLQQQSSN